MEFVFYQTADKEAAQTVRELLDEGRCYPIDKKWSVRVDRTHHDPMLMHNHVQCKGKDVAVMNQDGSPSHSSDLSKIPNWVVDWMKEKGLTEEYLLSEEVDKWERVPASIIAQVVWHEELMHETIEYMKKTRAAGFA